MNNKEQPLNYKQHALLLLLEECAEVTQRVTKAFRFGLNECQEGQNKDNTVRLFEEIEDLIGAIALVSEATGYTFNVEEAINKKTERFHKYLEISKQQGTLSEPKELSRPTHSICHFCKKKYKLDWSEYEKQEDPSIAEFFTPIMNDCGNHNYTHGYNM